MTIVLAPIAWGISIILVYGGLDGLLGGGTLSPEVNTTPYWASFYGLNTLGLFLSRYISTLPGKFLPLPYKDYWLATPTRQAHYFRVSLACA